MSEATTYGPIYCQQCPGEWDIEDMYTMSYDLKGNGECGRCGWRYTSGDQWVITREDLENLFSLGIVESV